MPDETQRTYRGAGLHSFRMDDALWARLTAEAANRGTSASELLRQFTEDALPA